MELTLGVAPLSSEADADFDGIGEAVTSPVDDGRVDALEDPDAEKGAEEDGHALTDDDADAKPDADRVTAADADALPLLQNVPLDVAVATGELVTDKVAEVVRDALAHDEDEGECDEDTNDDELDEADEILLALGLFERDAAGEGDALNDGDAVVLGDVELLFVAPADRLGPLLSVAITDVEAEPQKDAVREPLTLAEGAPDAVTLPENE